MYGEEECFPEVMLKKENCRSMLVDITASLVMVSMVSHNSSTDSKFASDLDTY